MPRRRPTTTDERIVLARLDGAARRILADELPGDQAIAAVHEITRDPRLLAQAAGTALGSWRANTVKHWQGRDVARLLLHAGADEELLQQVADDVRAKMPKRNAYGS